jgi:hypothetical protein
MIGKLFRGGVPTGSDVDKLMKLDPQPGVTIPYETVEREIGLDQRASRFRTVTTAWRRRLFRERMLQSTAEAGAFRFLTAEEAHANSLTGFTRLGKATGRVVARAEAVDTRDLPDGTREKHLLLKRELHMVREQMARSVRAIEPPKPKSGGIVRLAAPA